jgi:hypothetical protein
MAKQLRLQYSVAQYHVAGRGNEWHIYKDNDDYLMFLGKLLASLAVYKVPFVGLRLRRPIGVTLIS